jgi:heterodisulfide reductase subunit C
MDLPPHVVVGLVAGGRRAEARSAGSLWACMDCRKCTRRCPQGVDVARLFDELRSEALAAGVAPSPSAAPALEFHRAFLDSVRRHGRLHELGFLLRFRRRTQRTFENFGLAVSMFLKGKFRVRARRSPARRKISEILEHAAGRLFERGDK